MATSRSAAQRTFRIQAIIRHLVLILSLLLGLTRASSAQTAIDAARNKGLAWLITHQQANGSWRSKPGTEFVATATALEAFANSGLKNFTYAEGVSWLSNSTAASVDSLARQVSALVGAQVNVTLFHQKLLQWRNQDLAWGAYEDFGSSFPDIPLALGAIRKSRFPFTDAALRSALCWILMGQNQNASDPTLYGSWSYFIGGTGGAILPTAYNILELDGVKKERGWVSTTCNTTAGPMTFTLQTVIDNGINWLLNQRRKADGGFGDDSTSTVIGTALAYEALHALRPSDPATDAALNYLISKQGTDGSWNNDALQTAFVLKVLPPPTTPYVDTDKDGIPDSIETILGTNPNVADSRELGTQSMTSSQAIPVTVLSTQTLESQDSQPPSSVDSAGDDLNGDGLVDVADLALAEQVALGLAVPTQDQLSHGDVSPVGNPDGVIDVDDVERIRRKVLGFENF